jgi:hypothetical protein
VHRAATNDSSTSVGTPKAGRITTSSLPTSVCRLARVGQEADALLTQLIVDVRGCG